jgi:hypothetical protein
LQRTIRQAPFSEPRIAPYFSIASIVYWLHVGWKRHWRPMNGLSVS